MKYSSHGEISVRKSVGMLDDTPRNIETIAREFIVRLAAMALRQDKIRGSVAFVYKWY
jgi:hypothetical protein